MTLLLRPRTLATAPLPPPPPEPVPDPTPPPAPPSDGYSVRAIPYHAINVYGERVRIAAEFLAAGSWDFADPPSVGFLFSGSVGELTLTYPGEVVRDGVGQYHVEIDPGTGRGVYRWFGEQVAEMPWIELWVLAP